MQKALLLLTVLLLCGCTVNSQLGLDRQRQADTDIANINAGAQVEIARLQADATVRVAEQDRQARETEASYGYLKVRTIGFVFIVAILILCGFGLYRDSVRARHYRLTVKGYEGNAQIVDREELMDFMQRTHAIVRWNGDTAMIRNPQEDRWHLVKIAEEEGE